jgi:hypothetical protein
MLPSLSKNELSRVKNRFTARMRNEMYIIHLKSDNQFWTKIGCGYVKLLFLAA